MFFVHQLEEAYVQKSVVIAATHETAIVCPVGHKKSLLCSDGERKFVVSDRGRGEGGGEEAALINFHWEKRQRDGRS
jgi:hypothetical protein